MTVYKATKPEADGAARSRSRSPRASRSPADMITTQDQQRRERMSRRILLTPVAVTKDNVARTRWSA